MRNIKLIIEYDGPRYQGWQQPGKDDSPNTILGRITSVLKKMTMEELTIYSGLRTETGVHAFCQTINFKTNGNFSADSFKHYLNKYLPMDIAVVDACEVPERFHASLSAKSRTYLYQLVPGDVPSVFQRKYSWHSFLPIDADRIRLAAPLLCGRHDYACFSNGKTKKSTVRTVFSIDVTESGGFLYISICATDFLHNMARSMIGTLIDIGTGKRDPECIPAIFAGEQRSSVPCSPQGLILKEITY